MNHPCPIGGARWRIADNAINPGNPSPATASVLSVSLMGVILENPMGFRIIGHICRMFCTIHHKYAILDFCARFQRASSPRNNREAVAIVRV